MGSELGISGSIADKPRLDALGIFYITFAAVWTVLVGIGMTFLIAKRNEPTIKIRGIGLTIAAMTMLHVYWISVQKGYVLGPIEPEALEYWVMGIWLPLGMALFHASNSRFLHVATSQRRFALRRCNSEKRPCRAVQRKSFVARLCRRSYTFRAATFVAFCMGFQVSLTLLMFLISRKFHSSWGIPGTEVNGDAVERKAAQGRGWEWWPGVTWQLCWSWIVSPCVLWRSRHIQDTQGWRFQTIACCLVNLFATPMWLIALYVPGLEAINDRWIPPQWIALSIFLTEIFTIFVPCWRVWRQEILGTELRETLTRRNTDAHLCSIGSFRTQSTTIDSAATVGHQPSKETIRSEYSGLTMEALEATLEKNSDALQQFSALHDFSGENIAFLRAVAEWKDSIISVAATGEAPGLAEDEQMRETFSQALRIYIEFVSTRDAEFPVNLTASERSSLEVIFEKPARALLGDKKNLDSTLPFEEQTRGASFSTTYSGEKFTIVSNVSLDSSDDLPQLLGDVPAGFQQTIFDQAVKSTKYLVLTNTWPKFVKEVGSTS